MVGLYRVNDDYAKVRRMSIAPAVRRQVRMRFGAHLHETLHPNVTFPSSCPQGLARRLLDHIIDYASKEGFRRVILSTGAFPAAFTKRYHEKPTRHSSYLAT
jgi:GNAT superfamily N-acetyltransferase